MGSSEVSVIVVGAGPAGAATAIGCAQAGLTVVMLEANAAPRERPGETLHPGAEPLFDQLGVGDLVRASGFLRHAGIRVTWEGPERFAPYGEDANGPWLGIQAWRASLDAILRNRAAAMGVEVRAGTRAVAPVVSAGRITGVQTANETISARWVVDAAGGGHWLARRHNLEIQAFSPSLLARYGYVRLPPGDTPSLRAVPAGWTWRAEVRPGIYQWTQLPFGDPALLPPLDGEPLGKSRTADVTWRFVGVPAGPGYFIIGDAASVLDPASSHGVLRALMTGVFAGHLIARGGSEPLAATRYCEWLRDWFDHDLAALVQLYGSLPTPPTWLTRTATTTAYREISTRRAGAPASVI